MYFSRNTKLCVFCHHLNHNTSSIFVSSAFHLSKLRTLLVPISYAYTCTSPLYFCVNLQDYWCWCPCFPWGTPILLANFHLGRLAKSWCYHHPEMASVRIKHFNKKTLHSHYILEPLVFIWFPCEVLIELLHSLNISVSGVFFHTHVLQIWYYW